MSQTDLSRVKEDLEVLKQATGTALPFHSKEILYNLAIALCGIILIAWCLIPHGLHKAWGVTPIILVALFYSTYLDKKLPTSWRQSIMGGWRGWLGFLLVLILSLALRRWLRGSGIGLDQVLAICSFVFGGGICAAAIAVQGRLHLMAWGIVCFIGAGLIMFAHWDRFIAAGFSIGVGGLLTAVWQYLQLKKAHNHAPIDVNGVDSTTPGPV